MVSRCLSECPTLFVASSNLVYSQSMLQILYSENELYKDKHKMSVQMSVFFIVKVECNCIVTRGGVYDKNIA